MPPAVNRNIWKLWINNLIILQDLPCKIYFTCFPLLIFVSVFLTFVVAELMFIPLQIRSAVAELKNAVRIFSQLSAVTTYHAHGFDEKKIETHVGYCKHLLEAAKVHCEAAEREEQQARQKMEVARQLVLAENARRKAEEQKKFLVSAFFPISCFRF